MNRARVILEVGLVLTLVLSAGRSLLATLMRDVAGLSYVGLALDLGHEIGAFPWSIPLADDPASQVRPCETDLVLIDRLMELGKTFNADESPWNYLEGHVDLAQADFEAAIGAFESSSSANDRKALALFLLGASYALDSQPVQAIQAWRRAPGAGWFFLSAGARDLYSRGTYENALRHFSIAAEIEPTLCEPRYRVGLTWLELDNPQQALLAFSSTETLDCPDVVYFGESYYQRGGLLAAMGRHAEAIEMVRRSLSLDRSDAKRLTLLGDLLSRSGDHEEANSLYAEAISVDPQKMWPYIKLCDLHLQQKEYQEALSWCAQAVKLFPEDMYPHFYLGRVHLEMGDLRKAVSSFEEALNLDPTNVEVWVRLGDAYMEAEEGERAMAAYQRALELQPDNSTAARRILELTHE